MSRIWRSSAVTAVDLFLETCAFYLVIKLISFGLQQPTAVLPFWLVFIVILWAFLLSHYAQTFKFSANLRGLVGLGITLLSVLGLAHLKTGLGLIPVNAFLGADLETAFYQVLIFAFLVLLWWRGSTIAQDDISLDVVRNSFQWGLIVLFASVLVDSVSSADVVSGFMIMGFFGVGLAGLSLARFTSESGGAQVMSLDWWVPILLSVSAVLALGLLISAVGIGGLDDVTRAILSMIGAVGLWAVGPVLLALGFIAGMLVELGNWISSAFGGGDLSGLARFQETIRQFHESMRNEAGDSNLPSTLVTAVKWLGFLLAVSLAGLLLFRIYRFRRRFRGPREVEETRESLLSWTQANKDMSALLKAWWNSMAKGSGSSRNTGPEPRTPRQFYHAMLELSAESGRPREDWQTPREHQGTLPGLLPMEPVGRIVDGFQSSFYGGAAPEDPEIDQLRSDWTAITEYVDEQNKELLDNQETAG